MSTAPILRVLEVSAVFSMGDSDLRALEQVTFDVCPQEFICLLGPSGVGKSTLLRILAGLLQPTSGQALLHGRPISGPSREVGFVFQKANLMPWRTVLANIMLPLEVGRINPREAAARAQEMVELVGLTGFETTLPRDLSGGMAQRVAIARALIGDPEVLLLDEPFGSLDAMTRDRMGAELLRIWQARRKTVVMVTHSISEALFLADRVLVLNDRPGRVSMDLIVDLPRPRVQGVMYTAKFGRLARLVRQAIGEI